MNEEIRNENEIMDTETEVMDYGYENPDESNSGNFGMGMLLGAALAAGGIAGAKLAKKAFAFGKKKWEERKENEKESNENDNVIDIEDVKVTVVEEDEEKK